MNDLLNPVQRTSLRVTLRRFEESLRHAQAWLDGKEENGVLFQRKLTLSVKHGQQAEQVIQEALQTIEKVSRDFELHLETENAAALIRGEMSISWADLLDSRASELKRGGPVHSDLSGVLDPSIERLAGFALRLKMIFDE